MGEHNRNSGEHPDPALILAIRMEIEGALHPVREGIGAINERLARGDTALALLHQRVEAQERRCAQHQTTQAAVALQPKTEKTKKEMHPVLMVIVTAVVTSLANLTLVWWLMGIGGLAAKGSP